MVCVSRFLTRKVGLIVRVGLGWQGKGRRGRSILKGGGWERVRVRVRVGGVEV